MSREWMIIKSSIDKAVNDAVAAAMANTGMTLVVTEVEDALQFEKVLKDPNPAVLYQITRLSPNPRAPRFEASFNVGAKTVDDSGYYDLAKVLGELQERFKQGATLALHDYSDAALQAQRYGSLMVVDADVNPQQFDKQAGIRMLTCRAAVVCRGS